MLEDDGENRTESVKDLNMYTVLFLATNRRSRQSHRDKGMGEGGTRNGNDVSRAALTVEYTGWQTDMSNRCHHKCILGAMISFMPKSEIPTADVNFFLQKISER